MKPVSDSPSKPLSTLALSRTEVSSSSQVSKSSEQSQATEASSTRQDPLYEYALSQVRANIDPIDSDRVAKIKESIDSGQHPALDSQQQYWDGVAEKILSEQHEFDN